jgi:hypothetical protein
VSGFVYLLVSKQCFAAEEERGIVKEAKPDTFSAFRFPRFPFPFSVSIATLEHGWFSLSPRRDCKCLARELVLTGIPKRKVPSINKNADFE